MSFEIPPSLVTALRPTRHIAVLTGAGVSSESGVPTFRDAQTGPSALPSVAGQALWAQYDPHELATPEAFQRNPKLVWEWYAWRRELVSQARPNPGHIALVEMGLRLASLDAHFTLITQNVDGLHRQAGSENVIELHGNIHRTKCFREGIVIDERPDTGETPPRCPWCGGLLRPDVVWFGEALPRDALSAAINAAQTCDVFFSIGTSSLVQPAASLPYLASEHGAITVEINLDETPLTRDVKYSLRGKAGEVLPELVTAVGITDSASPPSGGGLFLRADRSRLEDQDTSQTLYNSVL